MKRMESKIVEKNRAAEIAKNHCPVIYQEFKSINDCIVPIYLEKDVNKKMNELVNHPTLYYRVREDENNFYIFYMVYHAFDWSDIPIIGVLDSHRHDSESILIKKDKSSGITDWVTVAHYTFNYYPKTPIRLVYINAENHAIFHGSCIRHLKDQIYLRYSKFNLINLDEIDTKEVVRIKKEFKKSLVNFPSGLYDKKLLMQYPKRHSIGDIYDRPERLFSLLEIIKEK